MNKCTICDCDFSEDDGVTGALGVIEVMFCNYCLVALEDLLEQKKEWVGLNGADWNDFNPLKSDDPHRVAEWVEKLLKERNGF